ncbi:hypothetical protein VN12_01500 [Pirellula sp. SH-Sr6A]|uniref:hypothetical protein n=1 Tax=Pirellula sp. SH-Sr6A TaxID=1632865 RepID=UPI00078B6D98|nr:hypothetical protein [Pirellula sp. SH-Sr6A]AMV30761.1 hypothetical protein VN12_01500 [Pirellula sp. SH-Sr6A]
MRKSKESIHVEKLELLAKMLGELKTAVDQTVADLKSIEVSTIETDGWPTLARGMQFVKDQSAKFVGPVRVAKIDPSELLMPGQGFAPTRKQSKKDVEAAEKKLAQADRVIAASKKRAKPKE